jgi:hypothetical protein
MTPETQPQAAAPGGFARYDDFSGPDLDAARWAPVHLRCRRAASTSRWTRTRSWPLTRARCA